MSKKIKQIIGERKPYKGKLFKWLLHRFTGGWEFRTRKLEEFAKDYHNKKILEIGAGKTSFKRFFDSSNEFVSSDFEGRDGHLELDASNFNSVEEYDAILLMSVMEHIPEFWKIVPNCYRALKKGGCLFIISPMFYPIHSVPEDFWRMTEFGLRFLLKDFERVELEYNGHFRRFPYSYWAKATKEQGLNILKE